MGERPVFGDPWQDLRGDGPADRQRRASLARELHAEVGPGHVLHGRPVEVIAQSCASDDIVVELATGGWARVHLTWRRAAEPPAWPATTLYGTTTALQQALAENA